MAISVHVRFEFDIVRFACLELRRKIDKSILDSQEEHTEKIRTDCSMHIDVEHTKLHAVSPQLLCHV